VADLKKIATQIFFETLKAIDLDRKIRRTVRLRGATLSIVEESIDLSRFDEVVLIGFGKASVRIGAALERVLRQHFSRGLLVSDRRHQINLKSRVITAGHPLPDERSLKAADEIIDLIQTCGERSLILFLISGGGSALIEKPAIGDWDLARLRELNNRLVTSGASINEINIVRKAVSAVKGGKLGRLAHETGARYVGLYVSDVNEGDVNAIASNPILPERIPEARLRALVCQYGLDRWIDLDQVDFGAIDVPPEEGGSNVYTHVLLDNLNALDAAAKAARSMGFEVHVERSSFEEDYKKVAELLIERLVSKCKAADTRMLCQISGGEVRCKVTGNGIGGRNSEFVLYSATLFPKLTGVKSIAMLSCGTDGIDGNSFAGGAVADEATVAVAADHGLDANDYINRNDSHSFFQRLGGVVYSGPTGNNVRDLRILIAERSC